MNFADRLQNAIKSKNSILCAGLDPVLPQLPIFIQEAAKKNIAEALIRFYRLLLPVIAPTVPVVKPNLAFFEQYGLAGLNAFANLLVAARELSLLTIADAKRGDIDSTAKAYAAAFLDSGDFSVDAITINPFLGFDTLEPFLEKCVSNQRGMFVLVKTSNPGSGDFQDLKLEGGSIVRDEMAQWIGEHSAPLLGKSGLSSLGAVVGATYPDEAKSLRALMPTSFFLIPGFGTQGGSADTARAGLRADGSGGIVNISRGLLGNLADLTSEEAVVKTVRDRVNNFKTQLSFTA